MAMNRTSWIILLLVVLAGCASPVPLLIRTAPPGSPSEEVVRANIKDHIGAKVRWGGTIASVENRAGETVIEIVARELQSNGRPLETDRSSGRFLARYPGFLEPTIYTKGRLLTVMGAVEGDDTRPIGQFSYAFPVVRVEAFYLWEPLPEGPRSYPEPYWDDPWWPYPYPWYRHPYWW